MSQTITVLEPVAPRGNAPGSTRHALDHLAGKVVGFIDNAKPNFNHLVDDLADLLVSKYGVARVIKRRKRNAGARLPQAVIEELYEQCDAVITGSGD